MTQLILRFPGTVSNVHGVFSTRVMARQCSDGRWEAWLEFARVDAEAAGWVTECETRQHDRLALERWASGLTRIYVEGALSRARALHPETPASELLDALHEIVETLDRRIPQIDRGSEPRIAASAKRLRASARQRIGPQHREAIA